MKVNDLVPVNVGAGVVAQAKITEVNVEDSTVTLIIPATKVVMAYSTQLAPEAVAPKPEPTVETLITGVDRASGESAAVVETIAPTSEVTNTGVETGPIETDKPTEPEKPVQPEPVEKPDAGGVDVSTSTE